MRARRRDAYRHMFTVYCGLREWATRKTAVFRLCIGGLHATTRTGIRVRWSFTNQRKVAQYTLTTRHTDTVTLTDTLGHRAIGIAVRGSRDLPSDLASANISEILSEYQARGGLGLGGLLVGSGLSLKLIKGRIHLASAMEVTQRCASVSLLRRSTWCHATPRIQLYAKHLHDGGGGDGGGDGGGAPAHHNTPILGAHRSRAEVLCVRGQGESLQVFEESTHESTPIAFPTAPDPTSTKRSSTLTRYSPRPFSLTSHPQLSHVLAWKGPMRALARGSGGPSIFGEPSS